jgi:ABC-type nitrate/sulfonate/bicarbonate transport system substrate-binding protein
MGKRTHLSRRRALVTMGSACALALPAIRSAAGQTPPLIRVGHGPAAEDQLWLMFAMPSVTPGQGKAYRLEHALFRGSEPRFKAFEAGALDMATTSAPGALVAASKGLEFKIIASISRDSPKGFQQRYFVLSESRFQTFGDLKGEIIGINGYKSATELYARASVRASGLDPDKDVRWAVIPFEAMGEALRSKRVACGVFPQPFAAVEEKHGGVRVLKTIKSGLPDEVELEILLVKPDFLAKHRDAVRAFLGDLVTTTRFYLDNLAVARKALLQAKLVNIAPEIYMDMQDFYRDPTCKIDMGELEAEQDALVKAGFQDEAVDVKKLVDNSLF